MSEETELKPGWKTSEFIITVITTIATLLNQAGILGFPIPMEAVATIAGMIGAYAVSRGLAK